VVGYHATDRSLAAQTAARDADQSRSRAVLAAANASRDKARLDLERRRALFARGFASAEQLTDLESAFAVAQANYEAAQAGQVQARANLDVAVGAFDANLALTEGAPLQDNPEIRAARARADQARLQLERTIVRAPVAGVIARRDVQIGQRVAAGERMMQVVPLDHAYVDANYKESQLRNVRPGQPVLLIADLYGRSVPYHGRVLGLSGGTGSVFAVIPTQNATGNWIKVVQRVSVRIALDPAELKAKPLRLGLSMRADIDTHAPRAR
jgi:membrane fusion protein (multidrug efflux system)